MTRWQPVPVRCCRSAGVPVDHLDESFPSSAQVSTRMPIPGSDVLRRRSGTAGGKPFVSGDRLLSDDGLASFLIEADGRVRT